MSWLAADAIDERGRLYRGAGAPRATIGRPSRSSRVGLGWGLRCREAEGRLHKRAGGWESGFMGLDILPASHPGPTAAPGAASEALRAAGVTRAEPSRERPIK